MHSQASQESVAKLLKQEVLVQIAWVLLSALLVLQETRVIIMILP